MVLGGQPVLLAGLLTTPLLDVSIESCEWRAEIRDMVGDVCHICNTVPVKLGRWSGSCYPRSTTLLGVVASYHLAPLVGGDFRSAKQIAAELNITVERSRWLIHNVMDVAREAARDDFGLWAMYRNGREKLYWGSPGKYYTWARGRTSVGTSLIVPFLPGSTYR